MRRPSGLARRGRGGGGRTLERALIIGASGGIGAAIAAELGDRGVDVVAVSRSGDGLDVTDEASVARALSALPPPFDLILVATGALVIDGHAPEKSFESITPEGLLNQVRLNALGPALVLKHALPLIPEDRRCVFAALSARVGSIGDNRIGGWHSYRAAKAALNQLIHGAAIEMRRTRREAIAVCLHPGTVATPLTAPYAGRHRTVPPQEAAGNLLRVIDGLTTDDSGGFFDWAGEQVAW